MSLSKRVRDCRYVKGWGPDELASRAEISRTALYQIECGKTELPRAGTLRRIARALDVSVDVLLGEADIDATGYPSSYGQGPGGAGTSTMSRRKRGGILPGGDETAFAEDAANESEATYSPSTTIARDRDLLRKFQELLASPMGDGIARIVEESYRLLSIHFPRRPK